MCMALDYNTISSLERVGNQMHIHYTDGVIVQAFTDGRGRYLPQQGGEGDFPGTYDPWTPPADPTDPPPDGSWVHPLAGATMTSGFGMRAGGFHYGADFSTTTAPTGGVVRAVTAMIITVAVDAFEGGNTTGGTYVKGHTLDGQYTFAYYHGADQSLAVAVGQTVDAGAQLFIEGQTGNVTGTHCHFEISLGNHNDPWPPPYNYGVEYVDPLPILREHGVNV